tara:strand:- start:215 stop:427 length:213 start_codon:yes stop_codon:yes gene_type:complete
MENQLKKIEEAASNWNKTKNPYYKNLWYQLIKEWSDGSHNTKRRVIPINTRIKRNNERYSINKSSWTNLL